MLSKKRILELPYGLKVGIAIVSDISIAALSLLIVMFFEFEMDEIVFSQLLQIWLFSLICFLPISFYFGLYREIFSYSLKPLIIIIAKSLITYFCCFNLILALTETELLFSIFNVLNIGLFFSLILFTRIVVKETLYDRLGTERGQFVKKLCIYGVTAESIRVFEILERIEQVKVIGFVHSNEKLTRRSLQGLPIYDFKSLARQRDQAGIDAIVVSEKLQTSDELRKAIHIFQNASIPVFRFSSDAKLLKARLVEPIFDHVDICQLIGRSPTEPDPELLSRGVKGKCVVVTGAGGSIGSQLCLEIVNHQPTSILLVDSSEYALYSVYQEICDYQNTHDLAVVPLLGSCTDGSFLNEIFSVWKPDLIYHAAAYKHVELLETNLISAVFNNVIGALEVAHAAKSWGVKEIVLVSSDKAVNPTSVMGATKRVAELIFRSLHEHEGHDLKVSIVRFGNVLGSSGSVIPKFRKQILAGGPVTVTHPEATRYFMTISEAVQLIIQAGALAEGGELFLLDMGEPVRILDLAKEMIFLLGIKEKELEDGKDGVAIIFTGLVPGEKLVEELYSMDAARDTKHQKIYQVREPFVDWNLLEATISDLRTALTQRDQKLILKAIKQIVPGYEAATPSVLEHNELSV